MMHTVSYCRYKKTVLITHKNVLGMENCESSWTELPNNLLEEHPVSTKQLYLW